MIPQTSLARPDRFSLLGLFPSYKEKREKADWPRETTRRPGQQMMNVGSRARHRSRMHIRQEAIFNSEFNGSCVEESRMIKYHDKKAGKPRGKPMRKYRSKLYDVSSRRVSDFTIRLDAGCNTNQKIRQDHKDDLVDGVLIENITKAENQASSCGGLDYKLNTNVPKTQKTRDIVTTTCTLMNTGNFPQISSEASTFTDSSDTTSGILLSLSPSYHDAHTRSRGLIDKLNG